MRVVRSAGENVSPSDDGRLFAQIFDDGLFTDATFTALGTNNVQISPIYGDLCGRDFTIEQMTVQVELPEGEGTETGVIYIEIDTSSDDVITVNSALDPFTPTYEDINTNGAVAQMVIAEYTATSLGVSSVTAAYTKLVKAGNVLQNLATVESGNTASQNYAVGDYVCVNGILYKVTAAIASGTSFVVGTNITATNVGAELSSLNSNLDGKELNFSDYFTINSGITINSSKLLVIAPHLLYFNLDAFGTVSQGQTVIGTAVSFPLNLYSMIAGRVTSGSNTYPITAIILSGGQIRLHSNNSGTSFLIAGILSY